MTNFELHPAFTKKIFITDLALCRVLLQDEKHYPWLFLIPRKPNLARLIDLDKQDQFQLIDELDLAQKIIWEEFQPMQLNVATIGNKIPQLHIHVIARYENDPAWPGTVWDHPVRAKYEENTKNSLIDKLKLRFSHAFLKEFEHRCHS